MHNISRHILKKLPVASTYWVAFSGGMDSHVLLHALAAIRDQLGGPLGAIHIDHGLQSQSADWDCHCKRVCEALSLPYKNIRVEAAHRKGESPEAAARDARYQALRDWLPVDAALMTAHHQNDQAETLLLQLLRGAGTKGLASMPGQTDFGKGLLLRPMLELTRSELTDYARDRQLKWLDDPSNTDTRFDRNYLRHRVMPELEKRWPSAAKTLSRAARHQADQLVLANALAEQDFACCRINNSQFLSASRLASLAVARQRNVLRYWVHIERLPLPGEDVINRIMNEVLHCRDDAEPVVHWPGAEVRRYRDTVYLMSPLSANDTRQVLHWCPDQLLEIQSAQGVLSSERVSGQGFRQEYCQQSFEVRFRRGGEVIKPAFRGHRHPLGKLFQEYAVPPWERERVPLLYLDDELVAVVGICVREGFQTDAVQSGLMPRWSRINPVKSD